MKTLECDSKGDKKYSAFYANVYILNDVKNIETWYQQSKCFKTGNSIVTYENIKQAKGKKPYGVIFLGETYEISFLTPLYYFLWLLYFVQNPCLYWYALDFDDYKDIFKGKAINCQADVIKYLCSRGLYKTLTQLYKKKEIKNIVSKMFCNCKTDIMEFFHKAELVDEHNYIGHIQLCSLNNLNNFYYKYDKKLLIVRSASKALAKINKYNLIVANGLSPSSELFYDYLRWQKGQFTNKEREIMELGKTHSWWDLYTKRFIYEIKTRDDLRKNLKALQIRLKQGYDILLICFCEDWRRCHRSIIGYYLMKKGYEVNFG